MGAPVRIADALMTRLAVPVTGDDLLGPFLDRRPGRPAGPLPEPRNLAFASGLDDWIIGGSFKAGPTLVHRQDYSATAADGVATLCSAVPEPYGNAFLGQAFTADGYRGATVTFGAEIHAEDVADQAELWLHVVTRDRSKSVEEHRPAVTGRRDWTRQEVTGQVPEDAELTRFGLTLTGAGRIRLRNAELIRVG